MRKAHTRHKIRDVEKLLIRKGGKTIKDTEMKDLAYKKRLFDIKEAALYLGLSPKTLYNGVHKKSTKPFPVRAKRVGGKVLFDILDLEKYVDSL